MSKPRISQASVFVVISTLLIAVPGVQSKPPAGAGKGSPQDSSGAGTGTRTSGKGSPAGTAKGDSIESIKFQLQKEFKSKRQIFRLKRNNLADSILDKAYSLTLPQILTLVQDSSRAEEFSTQDEFRNYWSKVEFENGIAAMKSQYTARDPDRSRIPKIYLADSSVVILPGWIVLRIRR